MKTYLTKKLFWSIFLFHACLMNSAAYADSVLIFYADPSDKPYPCIFLYQEEIEKQSFNERIDHGVAERFCYVNTLTIYAKTQTDGFSDFLSTLNSSASSERGMNDDLVFNVQMGNELKVFSLERKEGIFLLQQLLTFISKEKTEEVGQRFIKRLSF